MHQYQLAAWATILGLSFMSLGGLVLWAYGARRTQTSISIDGVEADATRLFHTRLTRWFFTYGVVMMVVGCGLLMWAGSVAFK